MHTCVQKPSKSSIKRNRNNVSHITKASLILSEKNPATIEINYVYFQWLTEAYSQQRKLLNSIFK